MTVLQSASSLKESLLQAHNEYRKKHNTPPLLWSDKLASRAQQWADEIAKKGRLEHCDAKSRNGEGENLACAGGKDLTGSDATKMWYDEIKYYDFSQPAKYNPKCGHFTQVVWYSSKEVGAGISQGNNGMIYIVARYAPAGNNLSKFVENILRPIDIEGEDDKEEKTKKEGSIKRKANDELHDKENRSPGDFKSSMLSSHNKNRKKHNTPPLQWSEQLAKNAQQWANHLAKLGKLQHAQKHEREGQGENLAFASGKDLTGSDATEMWYGEIKDYDFTQPAKYNPKCGHFTQVVWAESTELGGGIAKTNDGKCFLVARYSPPGNMLSKFEKNIKPLGESNEMGKVVDQTSKPAEAKKLKVDKDNTKENNKTSDAFSLKESLLQAHNEYRKKHNTPPLLWSDRLASRAQQWADEIAKKGRLEHCDAKSRNGEGENLACAGGKDLTGSDATKMWYDEIKDYDFTQPAKYNPKCGHFTQVVWYSSKEVGAGISKGNNGMIYIVARYAPAGNNLSKFVENILKPVDMGSEDNEEDKTNNQGSIKRKAKDELHDKDNRSPGDFKSTMLSSHNQNRKKHNTPPLQWSEQLAKNAQQWANHLAKLGKLQHAQKHEREGQGENLAFASGKDLTGSDATDMWYDEIKDYDFTQPAKYNPKCGHFTQVVWAESTELGGGIAKTNDGKCFVVARYSPPGNMLSKFQNNVKPLGDPDEMGKVEEKTTKPDEVKKLKVDTDDTKNNNTTSDPDDFKSSMVFSHNQYRNQHNTPPLQWSEQLGENAQQWANHLAKLGKLQHARKHEREGQGENLAFASGKDLTGSDATKMWYDEIKDYDFSEPAKYNPKCGHFTQVIWEKSTELGVGVAKTNDGKCFVVARYSPPGNMLSKFEDNVKPLGKSNKSREKENEIAEPVETKKIEGYKNDTDKDNQTSGFGRRIQTPIHTDIENNNFDYNMVDEGSNKVHTGPSKEDIGISNEAFESDYIKQNDAEKISFKNGILTSHNEYRQKHGASPLFWSKELADRATKWAEHLAATDSLEHDSKSDDGENLAMAGGKDLTGIDATKMWYDEIEDYIFTIPAKYNPQCGHFTQVVWASSTQVGAGIATSKNGNIYVVARYSPAGNVIDRFETNVFRAGTIPSTNVNTDKENNNEPSKIIKLEIDIEKGNVTNNTGGTTTKQNPRRQADNNRSPSLFRRFLAIFAPCMNRR